MADKVDETPATSSDVPDENSVQVKLAENSDAAEGDPAVKRDENTVREELGEAKKPEEVKEEGETYREAKRRKNCPAALERSPSDHGFSFSLAFDTSICRNDSTPKFGSFKLGDGAELGLPTSDCAVTPIGLKLGVLEKEEAEKEKIVADSASVLRDE